MLPTRISSAPAAVRNRTKSGRNINAQQGLSAALAAGAPDLPVTEISDPLYSPNDDVTVSARAADVNIRVPPLFCRTQVEAFLPGPKVYPSLSVRNVKIDVTFQGKDIPQ